VLDLSWVVWRKDFYLFWGVTAFVLMPLALADGLVERWIDPDLANLVAPLRSFANVLFASLVSSGLMAMAVVGRLKGQPATAIQIVAVARFRPSSLMSVVTTVLLLLPAFCALVVPGIVLHVRWLLVGPIAALERHQSPRGRSTALTA